MSCFYTTIICQYLPASMKDQSSKWIKPFLISNPPRTAAEHSLCVSIEVECIKIYTNPVL